jgi:hypothetical protein
VRAEQEFGENPNCLPSLRKLNEPGVLAGGYVRIWLAYNKCGYMKNIRIETADDLAGIAHLRIKKALIGKTVHKNPNWPHPSPPRHLVAHMSR